jgi:protein ImuA
MEHNPFTGFPLRGARVHEVCGPSATTFAAIACAQTRSQILWIREAWRADTLSPLGLSGFFCPSKLLLAQPRDQAASLGVAEEALRDGGLDRVVVEITRPLTLLEGRRLQIAAKSGGATGICIIPEGMGNNAAETRWRAIPLFNPGKEDWTLMRWEIIKNKTGTFGAWDVCWDPETYRLHVVPPVGERPGSPPASA